MTGGQRAAVGLGLGGAFILSVAVGGFVARQLRATPGPNIAVASISASPAASAVPSSSPSPIASATAELPTSVPTAAATPLTTVPPTPSPTTAQTPAPTASLDPATAEEFATDLQAAINTGDNRYLNARLHPAVIARYGAKQCLRHLKSIPADPTLTFDVQGSTGPAPWTWTTDGLDMAIDDTWTVSVNQPGATPEARDLHFAPADGTWRWFTDCGTPV